jgi:hypothetical protein
MRANFLVHGYGYTLNYAARSAYAGPADVADAIRGRLLAETNECAVRNDRNRFRSFTSDPLDRADFVSCVALDFPDDVGAAEREGKPWRNADYTYIIDLETGKVGLAGTPEPFYGTLGAFVARFHPETRGN